MCIVVSRPMKIVTFLQKNDYPAKRVVDFPRERDTFRNKIMEIVEDFDEKSHNNNGKPWKSSRILRLNLLFIFLSFFIFSHFSFFSIFHFFFFFHISFFSFFFIFSFFSIFHFDSVHMAFFLSEAKPLFVNSPSSSSLDFRLCTSATNFCLSTQKSCRIGYSSEELPQHCSSCVCRFSSARMQGSWPTQHGY